MSYYYVVCEDVEGETSVSRFDNASLACDFIEKKLEGDLTYELSDFMVIHGSPLNIQVETKKIIRLKE